MIFTFKEFILNENNNSNNFDSFTINDIVNDDYLMNLGSI